MHIGVCLGCILLLTLRANIRIALIASVFLLCTILVESLLGFRGRICAVQYFSWYLLFSIFYWTKRRPYIYSLVTFAIALLSSEKAILCLVYFFSMKFVCDIKAIGKKSPPYFGLAAGWALYYLNSLRPRLNNLQTPIIKIKFYIPFI